MRESPKKCKRFSFLWLVHLSKIDGYNTNDITEPFLVIESSNYMCLVVFGLFHIWRCQYLVFTYTLHNSSQRSPPTLLNNLAYIEHILNIYFCRARPKGSCNHATKILEGDLALQRSLVHFRWQNPLGSHLIDGFKLNVDERHREK